MPWSSVHDYAQTCRAKEANRHSAADLRRGIDGEFRLQNFRKSSAFGIEAGRQQRIYGIDEPKKFEGKTVGYKAVPAFEYLALLKSAGVDRSKINEISVGFDPRILTENKIDVLPVFNSN